MSSYFYNPAISPALNSTIFWAWESFIHHMYFIVLFVQRQTSDKWEKKELWRVNMEKECAFFEMLFGGESASFCADTSSSIFAGLWFRTQRPNEAQLNWIGRLITNYQHCEAILHTAICVSALVIVWYLGSIAPSSKKTSKKNVDIEKTGGVPASVRWIFFLSLYIETYTMCFPYLFLFSWAWSPFVTMPKPGLVVYIESLAGKELFLQGIHFGAALITMLWVSIVVNILDAWAMWRAWEFVASDYKLGSSMGHLFFNGIGAAITAGVWIDFFSPDGRGAAKDSSFHPSEFVGDTLHGLFGDDATPMAKLLK